MSRMSELPVLRHTDKDYANITLYPECDLENGAYLVKANASVCQMGGSPSVEELLDAAEQITYDDDWHLNMDGELLCAANDIDEPYLPVNPAEGYRYEVIHHIC